MKRQVAWSFTILLPAVLLLAHPETRKVLLFDLYKLHHGKPYAVRGLSLPPEEKRILDALKTADERQRAELLERAYRETGQLWVGMLTLLAWSNALGSEDLTAREAESALKLVNELCAKDPRNAFPLLMKSRFLFAIHRDEEAIDALLQASRQNRFETYAREFVKILDHKALPADERLLNLSSTIIWAVAFKIGPFHRFVKESVTRLVNEGNPKAALQMVESLLDLGKLMREQSFWTIDALQGMRLQGDAIKAVTPLSAEELSALKAMPREKQHQESLRLQLKKFKAFASKHGRPDLAEKAEREIAINEQLRRKVKVVCESKFVFGYLTSSEFERLLNMRMAGHALLVTIGLLFAAIVLISVVGGKIFLRQEIIVDRVSDTERQMNKSAKAKIFVMPALAAIAPLGFAISAILGVWRVQTQILGELPIAIMTPAFVGATVALTLLWLMLLCIAPILTRTKWWRHGWSLLAVLSLLVAIVLVASSFVPEKDKLTALLEQGTQVPSVQVFGEIFGKPQPPSIAFLTKFPARFVLVALGLALFFLGIASRKGHPEELTERQRAVLTFYRSALLLMLICWWSYAIVTVASLPLRDKLHVNLNAIAEKGEWQIVREGLKEH